MNETKIESTQSLRPYWVAILGAFCIFLSGYAVRFLASFLLYFLHRDAHDPVINSAGFIVFLLFLATMAFTTKMFFRRKDFLATFTDTEKKFYSWFVAFWVWFFLMILALFELGFNISDLPKKLFLLHIWISLASLFVTRYSLKKTLAKILAK